MNAPFPSFSALLLQSQQVQPQHTNPFASPPAPKAPPHLSAPSLNPFDGLQAGSFNPFSPRRASFRVENFAGLRGHFPGDEDELSLDTVPSPTRLARAKSFPSPRLVQTPLENFGLDVVALSPKAPPLGPSLPSNLSGPSVASYPAFCASVTSFDFTSQRPSAAASLLEPPLSELSSNELASVPSYGNPPQQQMTQLAIELLTLPKPAPTNNPMSMPLTSPDPHLPPASDLLSFPNAILVPDSSQAAPRPTLETFDILSFPGQDSTSLAAPNPVHIIPTTETSDFPRLHAFTTHESNQDRFHSALKIFQVSSSGFQKTNSVSPVPITAFDPFASSASFSQLPSVQEAAPPLPPKPSGVPAHSADVNDDFFDIYNTNPKPSPVSHPIIHNPTPIPKSVAQMKLEIRASSQTFTNTQIRKPSVAKYTDAKESLDFGVVEDDDEEGDAVILTPRFKAPAGMDAEKLKNWLVSGDSYSITYETDTQLGMLLEKKDEHMPGDKRTRTERAVVKMVVAGGLSDVKDVSVGSKIVSINKVSVLGRPYQEILTIIRTAGRPLQIEFERTVLEENEDDIAGDCYVQKGRSPLAPFKLNNWKRMYYVLGGQIANANVLQLYNSRQEYEDAVIALFRNEQVPVKVKAYRLTMQYKTSNFKNKHYPDENEVVRFFVLKRPNATFKSLKIGYTEMEGMRKLHSQLCRYTTAGSRNV